MTSPLLATHKGRLPPPAYNYSINKQPARSFRGRFRYFLFALFSAFFMSAFAVTAQAQDLDITGGTLGVDYTYTGGVLTITANGTYTIGMTTGVTTATDRIVVASGLNNVNITLNGVNIDVSGNPAGERCAFDMTGATVNLTLSGDNVLKSGFERAGLTAPGGSTLAIGGTGRLDAFGGNNGGAGIGGYSQGTDYTQSTGGNITINSGTINATGTSGAGIGGGMGGGTNGGTITINGGDVTAIGTANSAGIGGGNQGVGGTITITGGIVIATGAGDAAGIGGGANALSGNIIISGGDVTAVGGTGGLGAGIGGGGISSGVSGNRNILIYGESTIVTATKGTGSGAQQDIGAGNNSTATPHPYNVFVALPLNNLQNASGNIGNTVTFSAVPTSTDAVTATLPTPFNTSPFTTTYNILTDLSSPKQMSVITTVGATFGLTGYPSVAKTAAQLEATGATVAFMTDAEAVATDKAALTWDVIRNTNTLQTEVTANLVNPLPTSGANGTTIAWSSNNTTAVSNAGVVTRPQYGSGDATVTLTATISRGGANDTQIFTLTVKEREPDFTITGGTLGTHYTYSGGVLTIIANGTYTIGMMTGITTTADRIVVTSNPTNVYNITLNSVNIDVSATVATAAFDITGATVNLTLAGDNELRSGRERAGLQAPQGATLTISGNASDKFTATGGEFGAGIGGGGGPGIGGAGGTITISGGTVTATGGGGGGAGIGGGGSPDIGGAGGAITISGGTVTATSSNGGAGIGGGGSGFNGGAGGAILIYGAYTKVTATGGGGAQNIGAGGGFTVGAAGNVFVALMEGNLKTETAPNTYANIGNAVKVTSNYPVATDHYFTAQLPAPFSTTVNLFAGMLNPPPYERTLSIITTLGASENVIFSVAPTNFFDNTVTKTGTQLMTGGTTIDFIYTPKYFTTISIPTVNGNAPAAGVTNPSAAAQGTTVNLPTVTANAGFAFSTWTVTSGGVTITNPTNAAGASFIMGDRDVTINAVFVPATLTFGNQTLASGTFGTAYSANVTPPTGGSGTYTYSATVPAGLTMSAAGAISGTPNAAITAQTFTVSVTDTVSGGTATATYTLTINKAAAPAITWPTSATAINYGQTLANATLNVTSDANGTFAWTDGTIAPTVAQSGNNFSVTYTPTDTANYDYSSVTLTANVSVTVNRIAYTQTTYTLFVGTEGEAVSYTLPTPAPGASYNAASGTATVNTSGLIDSSGAWNLNTTTRVLSFTATAKPDGTTAQITIPVTAGDNHLAYSLVVTVQASMVAQDNRDIAAALAAIEGAFPANIAQRLIADEAAALAEIERIINALPLNGVTPAVTKVVYTAAQAGTQSTPAGANGIYTFTVLLNKGGGAPQITGTLALNIVATAFQLGGATAAIPVMGPVGLALLVVLLAGMAARRRRIS